MAKTITRGRSAITGRFVKLSTANRNKRTTIVDRMKACPTKKTTRSKRK